MKSAETFKDNTVHTVYWQLHFQWKVHRIFKKRIHWSWYKL